MSIQIGATGASNAAAWGAQLQALAAQRSGPVVAAQAAAEQQVAASSAAMATGSKFSIMA